MGHYYTSEGFKLYKILFIHINCNYFQLFGFLEKHTDKILKKSLEHKNL